MERPEFIKNVESLVSNSSFSYPGDNETFGTGAAIGSLLGLKKIAINYEILQPGDRTSWPHAHSVEEEFIYVLEGKPEAWINGEIFPLISGDCVALPAGTNLAHSVLNNSQEVVKLIVVGQQKVLTDKIYYPLHPERNLQMKKDGHFWDNRPKVQMGSHDGMTNLKRK